MNKKVPFADELLSALAERFEVEPSTVTKWLDGRDVPTEEERERVIAILSDRGGWDSGMEQAARVVRAEAAQKEPRPLKDVAQNLQSLADCYPRSKEENLDREILEMVKKAGLSFPILRDLLAAIDGDNHPVGKAVLEWKEKKIHQIFTSPSKSLPGQAPTGSSTIICVGCTKPWPGGLCAPCVNGYMEQFLQQHKGQSK